MNPDVWIVFGTCGSSNFVDPLVFPIEREDDASAHYLALADYLFKKVDLTADGCDEDAHASVHKIRAEYVKS